MKKYFIISIAVAALFAGTVPVSADSVFNDMSKCVKSWGKGCGECGGAAKEAAAMPDKGKKCCCMKTDVLGNKVPCCTAKSGKVSIGK